jgi:hypothetical protein
LLDGPILQRGSPGRRAYVLVHFALNTDLSQIHQALTRPDITAVDLVMGPDDAIVSCETADYEQLATLSKQIRGCPGIRDSITCPVASPLTADASSQSGWAPQKSGRHHDR